MGLTTVLKLPYPELTDTADVPRDIKALADAIDLKLGNVGTTLPSTPADGQEFYYVADAANGIVWQLRYRAAAVGSYKWEFVGGGPLTAAVDALQTLGAADNNWRDLTTDGPTVTVPLAGDYLAQAKAAIIVPGGTAGTGDVGMFQNVGVQVDMVTNSLAGGYSASQSLLARVPGIGAAQTIKLRYKAQAPPAPAWSMRRLAVTPIRVG